MHKVPKQAIVPEQINNSPLQLRFPAHFTSAKASGVSKKKQTCETHFGTQVLFRALSQNLQEQKWE